MTERKTENNSGYVSVFFMWFERAAITFLLGIVITLYGRVSDQDANGRVMSEKLSAVVKMAEGRNNHEARLTAIETKGATYRDLVDIKAELENKIAGAIKRCTDDNVDLHNRMENVIEKLDARIRAIESGK